MRPIAFPLLSSGTLIACALLSQPMQAQLRHGGDIGNSVTANEADSIILRSIVDLTQIAADTGFASIANGNDCWGYTSPSGREYALMGTSQTTAIYEVTDFFNPTFIGHVPHASALWSDIKTYSTYAYVVVDGAGAAGNGIQVLDLSDVDNGNVTLLNEYKPSGMLNVHNIAVNETSGRLYTCLADAISNGIVAFDLAADPVNPPELGSYTMPGIGGAGTHDAHALVMSAGPWAGKEIVFCFAEEVGNVIVDMTNAGTPVWLSTTPYTNLTYSHQGWFDESTNLLYQNDELDEANTPVATTTTRIFDCTDLTSPTLVGTVANPRQSIDHNLYISNGILYEANYTSGVHMFDIASNPTDPPLLGYFDTSFTYENVSFNGAWNVYPFFASTTILVSDLASGLFVLDAEPAQRGGFPFRFSFPNGVPRSLPPVGATIDVLIEGLNGHSVGPANNWLHVLIDGVKTNFPLQHVAGDLYRGHFPNLDCGEVIWWIGADDDTGFHVHTPLHAPVEVFRAIVHSSAVRTFYEDGDNHSWALGIPGDTATTGMWESGVPLPSGPQPGLDSLDENDACFFTQNAPSAWAGVGANDIDGGVTTLVSPSFDGSGGAVYLSAFIWYSNESNGNTSVDDVLEFEVWSSATGTWTSFDTITTNTLGWERRTWRLDDFTTASSNMQIRLIAGDTGGGSLVEAALDHVEVYVVDTSNNKFDLNGDNDVNGSDLGLLLGSWGSPGATDLNGDGTTDGSDLGLLLGAWGLCVGGL
ncbi:MAG: choice-of-anchor B family protein [Phycisphaerales bacterium JB043]